MGSELSNLLLRKYKLSDIGTIITGKTPSTKEKDNFGRQIPFVTPKDFGSRKVINKTERYLTKKGAYSVKGSIIPAGSIMVSCIGTIGKVAIAGKECVTNQQINSIIVSPDFSRDYVYYKLLTMNEFFSRFASGGSVISILNKLDFSNIEITLPPKEVQDAQVQLLSLLDYKIELNQRMNETLEAVARALFKAWFVDFEPVKAKMNGEPYPLPDEIMDLFPDELVESELGLIPKGWRIGKLGDEFEITMGQSPPGSTYNEIGEGLPFYQGNRDFGYRYPIERVFCTKPIRIANPGDTLVSVRAPVGDINMAVGKCCIGRGLAGINHKSGNSSYTYYSLLHLKNKLVSFEGEGTVFGSINKEEFRRISIIIPLKQSLKLFDLLCVPFDNTIKTHTAEIENLIKIRNEFMRFYFCG